MVTYSILKTSVSLNFNIKKSQCSLLIKEWLWLVGPNGLSVCLPPKGPPVKSQSGHTPGLQARSPVGGVQESTTH